MDRYNVALHPEIMCTLTVNQILNQENLVRQMYEAGMRSVRINTAHLTAVQQLEMLTVRLKSMFADLRILIDTKGPEMRTTDICPDASIDLVPGMQVLIEGTSVDCQSSPQKLYVNYTDVHKEATVGDVILIDDGHISLEILKVEGREITAKVTTGGKLGARKGAAIKGVDLSLPAVSQHDRMYISYAATSQCIDCIAHSFVRSASDVIAVKQAMQGATKPVIAKIENQQGIDNISEIMAVADGVLIARGDLTASIGAEAIPQTQALIAKAAKDANRPLYLATNILPSLMTSVEVSPTDIKGIENAVVQGVDVMLLTNETASAPHPLESVSALHNAIISVKKR